MEVAVFHINGSETGRKVNLDASVFALETPNDQAIYQDVRLILANQRQGTHKAKGRGEIHGTSKKPFRQKGTGNARQGDRKSPLFRHGGRVFGPQPRSYGFKLNKKVKSLARRSALTYKARENKIKVVESFSFEAPKTKEFLKVLTNLQLAGKKVLFVLPAQDQVLYYSGRNLPKTQIVTAEDLNTYDILHADTILLTEASVGVINERLAN